MAGTWVFEDVVNTPLEIFLLQLALTLVLTRMLGGLFRFAKQPQVIGEIIAGIILGPSVMGHIPGFTNTVFPVKAQLSATATYDSTQTFYVIANTGLILFMFMMGFELDRNLLRKHLGGSVIMGGAAIVMPFAIGCAVATWLSSINNENQPDGWVSPSSTAFILFSGASMTFTAFPVLASILSAANLLDRPVGVVALSAAALDDIVAWCVLAVASSFAKNGSAVSGLYTLCLSVAYVLTMVFALRPSLRLLHGHLVKRDLHNNRYYFCVLMVLLIGSAYCTEAIGIHPFFGAFLMGLITPHEGNFAEVLIPRMSLVTREVLLPLYFVNSGIKTNIGTLNTARYWGVTLAIIIIATLAKFVPSCLATKLLTRRTWRFSVTIGLLMNTRGLVEIIALNIGLSLGILSTRLFTMLILMAIATTIITSPLVWAFFLRHYPDGLEDCDKKAMEEEVQRKSKEEGGELGAIAVAEVDDRSTNVHHLVTSDE